MHADLRALRDQIRAFLKATAEDEYMDTGDALALLERAAEVLAGHAAPDPGSRGIVTDPEVPPGVWWYTVDPQASDPDGAVTIRYDDGAVALHTYRDAAEGCVAAAAYEQTAGLVFAGYGNI